MSIVTDINFSNAGTPYGRPIRPAKPIKTALTVEDGIDFRLIELLFFAYRDFTSDPDQILSAYGFGRAHHRVLHFVNRMPGLTVAELLDVLKITKQSLARVLKQLLDAGYIIQVQGPRDRRQRELYPTTKGRTLALDLARPQSRRIRGALRELCARGPPRGRALPRSDGRSGAQGADRQSAGRRRGRGNISWEVLGNEREPRCSER